MELINSDFVFSLYPNLLTVDYPVKDIDINQLYEAIKYGYIRDTIEALRGEIDKEEYDLIKKTEIPCVTLSGQFNYRNSDGLIRHSGLIQIDIDKVGNYDILFHQLLQDDYMYMCFKSPGGRGIKGIIKINPYVETHLSQFYALEKYFSEKFGIPIDSQCKDVTRCLLLSFDPDIYCNPHALKFEGLHNPVKYTSSLLHEKFQVSDSDSKVSDEPVEVIEKIISSLEKNHIDITSTYGNWIKVGFALCTTFGEGGRSYFHRIGRMYPGYRHEETDRVYSQLLRKNNGMTRLGSVIFLARQAGVIVNRY